MTRESPTFFWLWKFSDCFVNVDSLPSSASKFCPRSIVWPCQKIKKIYSSTKRSWGEAKPTPIQIFSVCQILFFGRIAVDSWSIPFCRKGSAFFISIFCAPGSRSHSLAKNLPISAAFFPAFPAYLPRSDKLISPPR